MSAAPQLSIDGTAPLVDLRPIQERAIIRVRQQVQQGHRRVVLCGPTGFGKTLVGAEMIRRFTTGPRAGAALWLTNRTELLAQSSAAISARGIRVDTITATGTTSTGAACTVAAIDTLVARNLRPRAQLIVFDEAHHAPALTYAALLRDYPEALIVGLTATPERGDGIGLGDDFDALVVGATTRELVELGVLVPLRYLRPKAPLRGGTIAQGVPEAYLEHARGTQALVFSPSVELAQKHAAELVAAGIVARCVHGEMPAAERALYVEAFRTGAIQVLTNVAVLTEGFDAPGCSTILLARGCSTTGTFDQIVGRAVRCAPGKTSALLLDLRGQSHLHGLPFDGRDYSLTGVGIQKAGAAPDSYCKVCGQILEQPGPCPDCGATAEPLGLRVVKEELKAYDYITPMRKDAPEVRFARLVRWVAAARAKGHKMGSVLGKYRAIYGVPVPRGDIDRAIAELGRKTA